MSQATADFFEQLEQQRHEPLLEKAKGRIRFELTEGRKTERWLVEVDHGDVAVSHKNASGDCTIRMSAELFDEVARGEENAMAAFLRGAIRVEGDPELLVLFQRVFPGPPSR